MIAKSFEELIGNTPVIPYVSAEIGASRLWIKLEGYNPTGSIKDRAGISLIRNAISTGRLKPGMTILDASSGNMACALAYFGRVMGYPVEVVCSSKLTDDKAAFLRYFGAKLTLIGNFTIEGNQYCRDLAASNPTKYCFLDQLHNEANPLAAYQTLGPEILRDFPNVAAVVGSLGSGGSLSGTARFLKEQNPNIRIFSVEAAKGTKLPGTGSFTEGDYLTPFILDARANQLFNATIAVTESEAVGRSKLLSEQGFFCGLQTAGVVDAAVRIIGEQNLRGDIVAISGDSGWKNMVRLLKTVQNA